VNLKLIALTTLTMVAFAASRYSIVVEGDLNEDELNAIQQLVDAEEEMNRIVYIILLTISIAGCGGENSPESTDVVVQAPKPDNKPTPQMIPDDINITVINQITMPGVKRSLDVRLNKKVTKDVLHVIALKLKNSDSNIYERTFIVYYLPEMEIGAGGWATTHFNPNLDVRILGLTIEQEQTLKAKQPTPPSRKIVGSWLDDRPFVGSKITLFREGGVLYIETKYNDGSSSLKEVIETVLPEGRRFDSKKANKFGEYDLIDHKGNLQFWDQDGKFYTAMKLQR